MTVTESTDTPAIDLLDHRSFAGSQPHETFDHLRSTAPIWFHPEPDGPGFWALTSHELVTEVGFDAARFSSKPTIMIRDSDDPDRFGEHEMMLMTDPPVHTRMRRLVSRRFTPKSVRALHVGIERLATRIVDEVVERGECDLVTDLAGEMPSFVIADLLGIPLEDGRALYHHTETLHSATDAVGIEAQQQAMMEMYGYSARVFAERTARPTDDLASLIANGAVGDQPVDEVDFFLWFLLLVDAGGDTTRNLVGGGMHALFERPDVLAGLTGAPDEQMPSAIEELLRFVSPVIHMRRTATTDTTLGGQAIAEGDKVVMFYGAANRDPAVFDDPTGSICGGIPTPTSLSVGAARTSAWGPTWPGSRSRPCSGRCSRGWTGSRQPESPSGCAPTSSTDRPPCRSASRRDRASADHAA